MVASLGGSTGGKEVMESFESLRKSIFIGIGERAETRVLHVGLLPANQIPTRPQRPHVSHFQLANTATHVRSRVLLAAGRTSSTEPGASVRSFAPMFVASIFSHAEKKSAPPA